MGGQTGKRASGLLAARIGCVSQELPSASPPARLPTQKLYCSLVSTTRPNWGIPAKVA